MEAAGKTFRRKDVLVMQNACEGVHVFVAGNFTRNLSNIFLQNFAKILRKKVFALKGSFCMIALSAFSCFIVELK